MISIFPNVDAYKSIRNVISDDDLLNLTESKETYAITSALGLPPDVQGFQKYQNIEFNSTDGFVLINAPWKLLVCGGTFIVDGSRCQFSLHADFNHEAHPILTIFVAPKENIEHVVHVLIWLIMFAQDELGHPWPSNLSVRAGETIEIGAELYQLLRRHVYSVYCTIAKQNCRGCGKALGENLKICSGCCRSWYCGKECQRNAWGNHRYGCGKNSCATCLVKLCGRTRKLCGRCKGASYCSKLCQQIAWKRHKKHCTPITTESDC
jgi:hypothetical protein